MASPSMTTAATAATLSLSTPGAGGRPATVTRKRRGRDQASRERSRAGALAAWERRRAAAPLGVQQVDLFSALLAAPAPTKTHAPCQPRPDPMATPMATPMGLGAASAGKAAAIDWAALAGGADLGDLTDEQLEALASRALEAQGATEDTSGVTRAGALFTSATDVANPTTRRAPAAPGLGAARVDTRATAGQGERAEGETSYITPAAFWAALGMPAHLVEDTEGAAWVGGRAAWATPTAQSEAALRAGAATPAEPATPVAQQWLDPFGACEQAMENQRGYYLRALEGAEVMLTCLTVYKHDSGQFHRADIRADLADIVKRTTHLREQLETVERVVAGMLATGESQAAKRAARAEKTGKATKDARALQSDAD